MAQQAASACMLLEGCLQEVEEDGGKDEGSEALPSGIPQVLLFQCLSIPLILFCTRKIQFQ